MSHQGLVWFIRLGYTGLGYTGLGYTGLDYTGLGCTGLGYTGLGYTGLGYTGLSFTIRIVHVWFVLVLVYIMEFAVTMSFILYWCQCYQRSNDVTKFMS